MWKANTIRDSKLNKSVAIVVDKYAGKCFLYKNGALTHEFDAELGKKTGLATKGKRVIR